MSFVLVSKTQWWFGPVLWCCGEPVTHGLGKFQYFDFDKSLGCDSGIVKRLGHGSGIVKGLVGDPSIGYGLDGDPGIVAQDHDCGAVKESKDINVKLELVTMRKTVLDLLLTEFVYQLV